MGRDRVKAAARKGKGNEKGKGKGKECLNSQGEYYFVVGGMIFTLKKLNISFAKT
jgi:hypothetical protein